MISSGLGRPDPICRWTSFTTFMWNSMDTPDAKAGLWLTIGKWEGGGGG